MDPFTIALLAGTAISGVGGFLGSQKANKAQQQALTDARAQATAAYDDATRTRGQYFTEGRGYLDPAISGGDSARAAYETAMGLRGADAQRGYYSNFQHDPGYEAEFSAGTRALDRSAASRGGVYSGAQMAALQRYGQTMEGNAYQRRLQGLNSLMSTGDSARSTAAGMTDSYGRDLASMRTGYGDTMANSYIQGGQMKAANAMAPWQMMNQTMGNALTAYGGSRRPTASMPAGG